jgi:hypothetical protein
VDNVNVHNSDCLYNEPQATFTQDGSQEYDSSCSALRVGGWRLEVGGWRLEVGGWRLRVEGWGLK